MNEVKEERRATIIMLAFVLGLVGVLLALSFC